MYCAISSKGHLFGHSFILQQGNNPLTQSQTQLYRQEEQVVLQQMVWPPQSPDCNIMESSLGHLSVLLLEDTKDTEPA